MLPRRVQHAAPLPYEEARWPTRFFSRRLGLLELSVTLDELFGATSGEADRKAAVVVFALDAHDGSNAKTRVANSAPEHGVGIGPAFRG